MPYTIIFSLFSFLYNAISKYHTKSAAAVEKASNSVIEAQFAHTDAIDHHAEVTALVTGLGSLLGR